MKKFNFFLDIDNTLLPYGKNKISDKVFSAIIDAKKSGSNFFINTARPHWLVPKEIFPTDVFDGICSGCGTYITYHGKVIYKNFLDGEKVKKTLHNIEKFKIRNFSIVIEDLNNNYYQGKVMPWYISDKYIEFKNADELNPVYKDLHVQKFCFNKTDGDYPKGLFENLGNDFDVIVHPAYAEAVPKGFSKGMAIKIAEKELSIPHESTVAIGDSLNDTEMLKYAAISFAMGNAPENVKKLCNYVTDTSNNDGVASAIKMIIDSDIKT